MRSGFELQILAVGAIIECHLGISELRRRHLKLEGVPVPSSIPVHLLIDTGASCSWIDTMHMRSLGLEPRSWEETHTATNKGVGKDFPYFEVSLLIGRPASPESRRFELLMGGDAYINHGFDGLLGRDVLRHCRLGWNGPAGTVRFQYD